MDKLTAFALIISSFVTGLLTASIINNLILAWGWEITIIPILFFSYVLGEIIAHLAIAISNDLNDLHERD